VEQPEVIIVGGGPVGAALALGLQHTGIAVAVLDAHAQPAGADRRPLALSHGSRLILERLGVWAALQDVTPIRRIHISQRRGFGRVSLDAAETGLSALGYVADYGRVCAALAGAARQKVVSWTEHAHVTRVVSDAARPVVHFDCDGLAHDLDAQLIAVADGGTAAGPVAVRVVDYHQTALTARVRTELAHRHTAYECFAPAGPLALLPTGQDMALIWTLTAERARMLCDADEQVFLSQLHEDFGDRLGRFTAVTTRACYPLSLRLANRVTLPRVVMLGNAAQTLHPVAGQGFNMGLRDAWELAEIAAAHRKDPGSPGMLRGYEARRRLDRGAGVAFTDMLIRLFSNDIAPLRIARGLALMGLECAPLVKRFVSRRMTFGARG